MSSGWRAAIAGAPACTRAARRPSCCSTSPWLARTAGRVPALLLLTARPPVDEVELGAIVRTERLRRVELGRLGAAEIDELVKRVGLALDDTWAWVNDGGLASVA